MACKYLQRGGFMGDSVCGVNKTKLSSYTVNNVCDTWGKYMDCEDYKKASSMCFITSAVCFSSGKPDDCEELMTMRSFRDSWLMKQPYGEKEINDYYAIAPTICTNINKTGRAKDIYHELYHSFILPCVSSYQGGNSVQCYNFYKKMISLLKKKYYSS